MYYYSVEHHLAASFLPDLPFPSAPSGQPELFLLRRETSACRAAFRVTDPRQLTSSTENVSWLDTSRISCDTPALPKEVLAAIQAGTLTAVNLSHPRWQDTLTFTMPKGGKKRVHLLAVGDVGGTLLTA